MKNIFLTKSYFKFALVLLTIVILGLLIFPTKNSWAVETGLEETAGAAGLPQAELITIVGQIVYILLGFLGAVFIILILWGGFMRMTARGNSEQVATSMKIIVSAVIGLIIILASYAITAFVMSRIGASVGESEGYSDQVGPGRYPDTGEKGYSDQVGPGRYPDTGETGGYIECLEGPGSQTACADKQCGVGQIGDCINKHCACVNDPNYNPNFPNGVSPNYSD